MSLSVTPYTVQMIYGLYYQEKLKINRRYQRKLVWSINEKQSFIDSLIKGYPIPLILASKSSDENFEILDGLQRLNAIVSFIEGDFSVDGQYFDFNAITYTKTLIDEKKQKTPILGLSEISSFLNYPVPFGITDYYDNEFIDETFRRINTGGKQLSKQDVRQAGAIGVIPDIINQIAMYVRKDSTQSQILNLKNMKGISIGEKDTGYIDINNIFWVKNEIIGKDDIKKSRDEELIAYLLSCVFAEDKSQTTATYLDNIYKDGTPENKLLLEQINKVGKEEVIKNFNQVFDELMKIFKEDRSNFVKTVYGDNKHIKSSSAFQIIFLSIYQLMILESKKINNYKNLHKSLENSFNIYQSTLMSNQKWKNKDRLHLIMATKGVIEGSFEKFGSYTPSTWIKNLENIINESRVEQSYFDFKTSLLSIENKKFNDKLIDKILLTLTAMTNTNIGECMILVGIAENEADAIAHKKQFSKDFIKYGEKYIVGIEDEAKQLYPNNRALDDYLKKIKGQIEKNTNIQQSFKDCIIRDMVTFTYKEKEILLFRATREDKPQFYNGELYIRQGADNKKLQAGFDEDYINLITKFKKI